MRTRPFLDPANVRARLERSAPHLLRGYDATTAPVLTAGTQGRGDCRGCNGTGEAPGGRGVLFCDRCGGTGGKVGKTPRLIERLMKP